MSITNKKRVLEPYNIGGTALERMSEALSWVSSSLQI